MDKFFPENVFLEPPLEINVKLKNNRTKSIISAPLKSMYFDVVRGHALVLVKLIDYAI